MRAKAFALLVCGVTALALAVSLLSAGRLVRTVETAATEAGLIDRAA
jgi:hypothetical protein